MLQELNQFGSFLLDKLLAVAKTGQVPFDLKNAAATQIATTLARLIEENKHLRDKWRNLFTPTITATVDNLVIKFGPAGNHELKIPLTPNTDVPRLIDEFERAIKFLKNLPETSNTQLDLDLNNE